MIFGGLLQIQLGKNAAHMLLDGPLGDPQLPSYAGIGAALGHEREHLSLTRAEHRQRVVTVAGSDQLGD